MTNENKIKELVEKRNAVVMKYDTLKQPLRDKRELAFKGESEGLTETEWEMFDLIGKMMNEELAPIELELFKLGAI